MTPKVSCFQATLFSAGVDPTKLAAMTMAVFQLTGPGDDERYEVAVSYGTIIGTGALSLIICGARVSSELLFPFELIVDGNQCDNRAYYSY
jgi:hypothetical protein